MGKGFTYLKLGLLNCIRREKLSSYLLSYHAGSLNHTQ